MLGFYPTATAPLATAPQAAAPVPVPQPPSVDWTRVVPRSGAIWTPVVLSDTLG
jgi:hypothetical protein